MARYWFPAKRHGWGWGPPSAWQGWVALAVFVVLIVAGAAMFPPGRNMLGYLAYVFALASMMVALCWWKGEPPTWR